MRSLLNTFSALVVRRLTLGASLLAFALVPAGASVVTFTGEDLNAGPGSAHPNSSAAAANFDAAAALIGTSSIINFEGVAVGAYNSITVAPGVTLSGITYQGNQQQIMNSPDFPAGPALGGFNTTIGGSHYADELGGTLTFTFATPTQFFGTYLTGVQTAFYQDTITFSDGTSQTINVPGVGTDNSDGALDFVGFTDAGKLISSVTINAGPSPASGADAIGIDDVRYQTVPAVAATPEPGSLFLVGTGALTMAGVLRRKLRKS